MQGPQRIDFRYGVSLYYVETPASTPFTPRIRSGAGLEDLNPYRSPVLPVIGPCTPEIRGSTPW